MGPSTAAEAVVAAFTMASEVTLMFTMASEYSPFPFDILSDFEFDFGFLSARLTPA